MSAPGVQRDTVPSLKCDYPPPPFVCGVSKCAQHLRDGTVAQRRRRGQSVIVLSSPKARDSLTPG